MTKKFYVYRVTNIVNGKLYFGKTACQDPIKRWQSHLSTAKKPHDQKRFQYLHKAINKYGADNFLFEVIEVCDCEIKIFELEKYYIAKYNTFHGEGYNLTEGGDGASGYRHTKEAKRNMSASRQGRFVGQNNHFYGKTHTPKTKRHMSRLASQRIGDKNPFYGRRHSAKSLALMSKNCPKKQRYISFEKAEEIRKAYRSKKFTYKSVAKEFGTTKYVAEHVINFIRAYAQDLDKTSYPKRDNRSRNGGLNRLI